MIISEELVKFLKYETKGDYSKIPIFQLFGELGEVWNYNLG